MDRRKKSAAGGRYGLADAEADRRGFQYHPKNVLMHLRNIFQNGALPEYATAKDNLVVRQEGKRQVKRQLNHYNLGAVISVGYRVNAKQGAQFRIWATHAFVDSVDHAYVERQTGQLTYIAEQSSDIGLKVSECRDRVLQIRSGLTFA